MTASGEGGWGGSKRGSKKGTPWDRRPKTLDLIAAQRKIDFFAAQGKISGNSPSSAFLCGHWAAARPQMKARARLQRHGVGARRVAPAHLDRGPRARPAWGS